MSRYQPLFCWPLAGSAAQFQASTYDLAVTASPLWNFQPGFSLTVHTLFALSGVTDSAFS